MKYLEVLQAAKDILAQYDVALTLRQLFYRLVARHIFANTQTNYKRLSAYIVKAREDGDIPDSAIEDRTRTFIGGDWGYSDPDEFLKDKVEALKEAWENYTRPLWDGQPLFVMVGVEKDALSKLCSDVARQYRVKTCPTKGYSSYTYVKDIAARMNYEKPNILLYFGDYDPSGLDITRDLAERLGRYGAPEFQVKRIALTWDQVQEYKLPPMPTKSSDPRTAAFLATHGDQCVELDALEPDVLQRLIKEAIESHIDQDLWNQTVEATKKEREELKAKLRGLVVEFKEGGE